jgi:hypothetical protein
MALLGSACGRGLGPDTSGCTDVQAQIVTDYAMGPSCSSSVGVCTSGTVASTDNLAGTTYFTATSINPGPTSDSIVYSGELVITTPTGSVTLVDHGLLNSTTGNYIEIQEVVAGTGDYTTASGTLTSAGTSTATGFQGNLSGSICPF